MMPTTPRRAFHLPCPHRVVTLLAFTLVIACGGETNTTTDSGAGAGSAAVGAGAGGDPALEKYLSEHFEYVSRVEGFYIAGVDEPSLTPDSPGPNGRVVFEEALLLFSSYLDQDDDGEIDDPQIVQNLGANLVFIIGYAPFLEPHESAIESQFNRYAMSMKTDAWPFVPSYDGKDFVVTGLRSSMWRPEPFNAQWEETFHTITEAYNRSDSSWSFEMGSVLSTLMQADIDAGQYDIEEQNQLEGGNYDWQTAVNEYVHQIWAIHFGEQADVLTDSQQAVLDHMKQTPGFPMAVNTAYSRLLALKIK
jgi:hypothetical protein